MVTKAYFNTRPVAAVGVVFVRVAVKVDMIGTEGTVRGPVRAMVTGICAAIGVTWLDGVDSIPFPPALFACTVKV